ncbi:flavoredoxin [Oxobacter pfennigii]|uniref:Flavoredoxin n=1 Tax=Oxobacter pfennigii TaxID=36849 RepID=A0A0P8WJF3_9CLOT|nr:flavin reductase family protein [Oxobacter pfennigii]KPU42284.1 flavoredoxin [Oxobacter pfennigii]
MYRQIKHSEYSKEILEQLQRGAFLTVKSGDKVNTMTIGWGALSVIWGKPVFTVLVRKSRYTYEIIEESHEFTVSLPIKGQLKEALGFCGSKSGRNTDKFKECNLTLKDGQKVNVPVIDECDIQIECKIVYKQDMDENCLDADIKSRAYAKGDYHTIYYGEIVSIYIKE